MPDKFALHFGAGAIGRGFLGQVYCEAGLGTVFVDIDSQLVDRLNVAGAYTIRMAEPGEPIVTISNIRAILATDRDEVCKSILSAAIISVSVGEPGLPGVAQILAAGLSGRHEPVDVLVCENRRDAAAYLRGLVAGAAAPDLRAGILERTGFVATSIGRMVPPGDPRGDALEIRVEPYCELPVDAAAFRAPVPRIPALRPMPQFDSVLDRKLYVHNAGHAAAAYLGYRLGREFVWQAMEDSAVAALTGEAMKESCEAIARCYGVSRAELDAHRADLLRRFANSRLRDPIARVARDPLRKLRANDRLIGAMLFCLEHGVEPPNLGVAAAAALRYDPPGDSGAAELVRILETLGTRGALERVAGVARDSRIADLVVAGEANLRERGWIG